MDKLQKNNRFAIYSALVFVLLIIINGVSGLLTGLDNRWLDSLVTHHAKHNKPDADIVVVDIDENSLHQLNSFAGEWPWPRSVHATLLDELNKQHPKAIVFDIFFTDPDAKRAESDQTFIDSLSKIDNVFLPVFEKTGASKEEGQLISELPATLNFMKNKQAQPDATALLIMPNAIPSELWKVGATNETLDADNIERRYNIYRTIMGWRLPALPTRLASYLGFSIPNQKDFIIDWQQSNAVAYPTFPYSQVLVNLTQNIDYPSKNYFAGKIIVIGSTAINSQTNRITPISHEHPSAQILATAIDNLKNHSFLSQPFGAFLNTFITLLLLLYVFVWLMKTKHHLTRVTIALTILSAILISISYISASNKTLIPVAGQLFLVWLYFLINVAWQCGREALNQYQARALFGRSVSVEALRCLSAGDLSQHHNAQKTTITVLCCSIQHFSELAQQHEANTLTVLLNDYFNEQTALVFKHHGTLDNTTGGTLLAFWGAPMPCEKQSAIAVSTAIQMIENLALFKKKHNLTTLNIGIGIHTGLATVGIIGATAQQHYTAIGHTIDIAKAIKSLVSDKSTVFISADTKNACDDDFHFIELGKHHVLSEKMELELFEPKRKYL
jgi:adenylate cyclase